MDTTVSALRSHRLLSHRGAYAAANLVMIVVWIGLVVAGLALGSMSTIYEIALLVGAAILWCAASRRRAADIHSRLILGAPLLTICAFVAFLLVAPYGEYEAVYPNAKTPTGIEIGGIVVWALMPAWPIATLALSILPARPR